MLMKLTAAISNFLHWLFKPMPKIDPDYPPLALKRLNRFTQAYYNHFVRSIAEKSVLYSMAVKEGDGGERYGDMIKIIPNKWEKPFAVRPWPQRMLLHIMKLQALSVMKTLDILIAHSVKDKDPIVYRRTMTIDHLLDAGLRIEKPFLDIQHFDQKDTQYMYYVCFTTHDRIDYIRHCEEWQPRVEYAAYVDRQRYETEAGRVQIAEDTYVVFVVIGENSDDLKQSIMIGADARIVATPLKDNLRVVLTDIPTTGKPVEGTAVHWRMRFAAGIGGSCAVLVARKRCK